MVKNSPQRELKDRYLACITGGAIGDGMGYALEYEAEDNDDYEDFFVDGEVTRPLINKDTGNMLISDDTQLTLFTIDGLLWAYIRCTSRGIGSYEASGVWQSYARWYYTQTGIILDEYIIHKHEHEPIALSTIGIKTILDYEELYSNRGCSEDCIIALGSKIMGTTEEPINDCKDPSGLTRVAPVGLFLHDTPTEAFLVAARLCAITHGHPTAYLAAGTYAYIIAEVTNGKSLSEAVQNALGELRNYQYYDEVNEILEYALHLSECDYDWEQSFEMLGEGWNAEDVLAIGVFCALKADTYDEAIIKAVNTKGNHSALGSVCGSVAGALMGMSVIPESWAENLELRQMMILWVDKLYKLREF